MEPIALTILGAGGTAGAWLASKLLGPTADLGGEALAARVQKWYKGNIAETGEKAAEMVQASGVEPKELPMSVLVPILDGAAREDDGSLREMWAALLANAALADDPREDTPPLFAHILGNLTPLAARVLATLSRQTSPASGAIFTHSGGFSTLTASPNGQQESHLSMADSGGNRRGVSVAIDLLCSHGLAERVPTVHAGAGLGRNFGQGYSVHITNLGLKLVSACTPPAPPSEHRPVDGSTQ